MNAWGVIAGCAAVTAAIKAAGPIALGGRALPGWFTSIVGLLTPALLVALVITSTFAHGHQLAVGANAAGVAVAGVVFLRGGSVLVGVLVAAVVTALLRLL